MSRDEPRKAVVGLISDTHGRLSRSACVALAGVDHIVHAGDVCSDAVLVELEAIAPVTAVAGNCDTLGGPAGLETMARVTIAGARILVIHDLESLAEVPQDVDVVVCGHTHRPREQWWGRALIVNPGSASERRSMPTRSVALLRIADGSITFTLVPVS